MNLLEKSALPSADSCRIAFSTFGVRQSDAPSLRSVVFLRALAARTLNASRHREAATLKTGSSPLLLASRQGHLECMKAPMESREHARCSRRGVGGIGGRDPRATEVRCFGGGWDGASDIWTLLLRGTVLKDWTHMDLTA